MGINLPWSWSWSWSSWWWWWWWWLQMHMQMQIQMGVSIVTLGWLKDEPDEFAVKLSQPSLYPGASGFYSGFTYLCAKAVAELPSDAMSPVLHSKTWPWPQSGVPRWTRKMGGVWIITRANQAEWTWWNNSSRTGSSTHTRRKQAGETGAHRSSNQEKRGETCFFIIFLSQWNPMTSWDGLEPPAGRSAA